jgi:hypothetical protein
MQTHSSTRTASTSTDFLFAQLEKVDSQNSMLLENQEKLLEQFQALSARIASIEQPISGMEKKFFSTLEVAELVGKSSYTVREWCRLGRISASKRESGFGDSCEWEVSAEEVERYQIVNHTLVYAF